jgi:drug/metabolite transporter (DMT)-like permease
MLRGGVYGLSAAAIWGGMYVVSDVILHTIPPFALLAIRLVMAAGILGVVAWRTPGVVLPAGRGWLHPLGVGMVGFGISVGAQFVGTDKSNAVNGSLVTSASPAFILVFAALILREKLTFQRLAAVALATIGVLVIIDLSQADFSSDTFVGNLVLAVAALTWGLFSVLVRQVSVKYSTLVVTLVGFLGGLILVIPAAVVEAQSRTIGEITPGIVLGVLYLGVVSTALAMWLWNRAFALVDASVAGLFFFAQPLVGALLSVIFLNQRMTPNLWRGGALIGAGVLLSLFSPSWLPVVLRRASEREIR